MRPHDSFLKPHFFKDNSESSKPLYSTEGQPYTAITSTHPYQHLRMHLKFPSGFGSISFQLLRYQLSQPSCGICCKLWVFQTSGCLENELQILHPCQHFVGSGCWSRVPDELKDKCPVCNVKIECNEKVHVSYSNKRSGAQEIQVEGKEKVDGQSEAYIVYMKMKEGLNRTDVGTIMYYMNLRARLHTLEMDLGILLAPNTALSPAHRERLVLFLANTPSNDQEPSRRKIEVALSAFNIIRGTKFSLNDLKLALSSADRWIRIHFAAIFEDEEKLGKKASDVRCLEKRLAEAKVELQELKDRQARDNARESTQRLEAEIKQATDVIEKKAEIKVGELRAEIEKVVAEMYTSLEDNIQDILTKAKEDIAKLQSHGERRA